MLGDHLGDYPVDTDVIYSEYEWPEDQEAANFIRLLNCDAEEVGADEWDDETGEEEDDGESKEESEWPYMRGNRGLGVGDCGVNFGQIR
jgi:hypothetical protein